MKIPVTNRKKARIEMLPLIDIVFLLLVFFIFAMLSMAVHRGLPVVLPVSETAAVENIDVLAVSVLADGSLAVDGQSVVLEDLTAVLRLRLDGMQKAGVAAPGALLFADHALPYQRLFEVMDRIRQAGIHRLSLQAEREAKGR